MNTIKWLHPWEEIGEWRRAAVVAELKREVGPGHKLYEVLQHVEVQALGQRGDCDDTMFLLVDHTPAVAMVHLTFASSEVTPAWPSTELYATLDDWVENCMKPDHLDYFS